jgi:hypothetical protein
MNKIAVVIYAKLEGSGNSAGLRGEVRPHCAKTGCRAALQPRKPKNRAQKPDSHVPKAYIKPLAPPS